MTEVVCRTKIIADTIENKKIPFEKILESFTTCCFFILQTIFSLCLSCLLLLCCKQICRAKINTANSTT